MDKVLLGAGVAALATGCVTGAGETKQITKPNVLFVAVDDLRTELGCYGVKEIKTPNIDRLAKSGVTFTNHYVQVPTCGASRAALLTGRRPTESRAMGNHALTAGPSRLKQQMQESGAQTFPELFKRSGYHTVQIGKISHMPDGKVFQYNGKGDGRAELPHAWSEFATPYGKWKRGHGCFFAYEGGRHREDGTGFRPVMQFPDVKDNELPDGMMAETAVKKLDELKDKPFMMAVGFYKPHLPFVAPKKYRDMYNNVDVKLAPVQTKGSTGYWHGSGEFYKYQMDCKKTKPLAKKDQLEAKKAYYACVSYMDAQVGLLLDKLKETGLDKNTIVVLWGDHGWHLGDHAIWGKHSPLEKALHSPLIIRDPRNQVTGKTAAVVETVDIYPTLVDLCKPSFNKSFYKLGGVSIKPALKDIKHPGKNGSISYWGRARSIRSGNYRLIASKSKKGYNKLELYDHSKDPHETTNIKDQKPEVTQRLLELIKKDSPVLTKN